MTQEQIEELIEMYGFEYLTGRLQLWEVLEVLDENGYINLESYLEPSLKGWEL